MVGIATTLGVGASGRHSSVLKQSEDVAIRVGDGGHEEAATNVARGLRHDGTGSGHLGQLRLEVRHGTFRLRYLASVAQGKGTRLRSEARRFANPAGARASGR
jgi:hypothetical protein